MSAQPVASVCFSARQTATGYQAWVSWHKGAKEVLLRWMTGPHRGCEEHMSSALVKAEFEWSFQLPDRWDK